MIEAKHHIPNEILVAYSTGTLPEAFSIIVACHISLCDKCRVEVEALDAVGGAILTNQEKIDVDEDSFLKTMELISNSNEKILETEKSSKSIYPNPLKNYIGHSEDEIKWKPIGGGIKQSILFNIKDASARLLSIPAGMELPDHSHKGLEMTMVLQGAFSDEVAHFERGDIEIGDDKLTHTPKADPGELCICLVATQAPLVFNNWLPKILQPFIRI